jgi:hypothetical protein
VAIPIVASPRPLRGTFRRPSVPGAAARPRAPGVPAAPRALRKARTCLRDPRDPRLRLGCGPGGCAAACSRAGQPLGAGSRNSGGLR